jgi:hypothetical protein
MRVRVTPVYGYGWYPGGSQPEMEVPGEFSFEATIFEDGSPFKGAFGLVSEPDHPLTGLWVVLWQRSQGDEPAYNLSAFAKTCATYHRATPNRLLRLCNLTIFQTDAVPSGSVVGVPRQNRHGAVNLLA